MQALVVAQGHAIARTGGGAVDGEGDAPQGAGTRYFRIQAMTI